jgi:hypothetical protein
LICAGFAFAQQVSISQTFDSDRIVDYALDIEQGERKILLRYTFEKDEKVARIKYDPSDPHFESFRQLEPALFKLIQKADEISGRRIVDFMTFEFLGCDDIAKKAVLAFHDSPAWKQYLKESKKTYVAPPYDHIRKRMIQAGIFNGMDELFLQLGYTIEFSSFEKLAVREAKQFSFFKDLVQYGIGPEDEFPVPLMLYFKMVPK